MLNQRTAFHPSELRVKTWQGLRPIEEFDEIEIHEMVEDPDSPGDLVQASDYPEAPVTAYTVFLHCHSGGIETVQDFWFKSSQPGAAEAAKEEATQLGTQLLDMLSVSGMLRSIR